MFLETARTAVMMAIAAALATGRACAWRWRSIGVVNGEQNPRAAIGWRCD